MLRFLQWCRNNAIIPFPILERNVYAFMVDVGHSAAPTFLRSFLVSLVRECRVVQGNPT